MSLYAESQTVEQNNIMGDLLQLVYRYQDAKAASIAAQQAELEAAALLHAIEAELKKAASYAYHNDDITHTIVTMAIGPLEQEPIAETAKTYSDTGMATFGRAGR